MAALVCHAHVGMALHCLGSLVRHGRPAPQFVVHDDGTLTEEDVRRLEGGLAGCRVIQRSEADDRMAKALARHPKARSLRERFPLALKLLDAPLLCVSDHFAFCDSDVLFLRPVEEPFALPAAVVRALFIQDRENCYSVRSWQKFLSRGLRLPSRVNTGLISFDLAAYDLDFIEWFVGKGIHHGIPQMVEQTAWAALGLRAGCATFDPSQVRVMRENESTDDLVAGHFTARTRGLLPTYVALSRQASASEAPVAIRSVPAGECSAWDLARFEARRIVRCVGLGG